MISMILLTIVNVKRTKLQKREFGLNLLIGIYGLGLEIVKIWRREPVIKHVKLELYETGDLDEDLIVKAREMEGPKIRKAGFREGDEVVLIPEKELKIFEGLIYKHAILWNRYKELAQRKIK